MYYTETKIQFVAFPLLWILYKEPVCCMKPLLRIHYDKKKKTVCRVSNSIVMDTMRQFAVFLLLWIHTVCCVSYVTGTLRHFVVFPFLQLIFENDITFEYGYMKCAHKRQRKTNINM